MLLRLTKVHAMHAVRQHEKDFGWWVWLLEKEAI